MVSAASVTTLICRMFANMIFVLELLSQEIHNFTKETVSQIIDISLNKSFENSIEVASSSSNT